MSFHAEEKKFKKRSRNRRTWRSGRIKEEEEEEEEETAGKRFLVTGLRDIMVRGLF